MISMRANRIAVFSLLVACLVATPLEAFAQCCPVPTNEQTVVHGAPDTATDFLMTISDGNGTTFDSRRITEGGSGPDGCSYPGGPLTPTMSTSGSTWVVAAGDAQGQRNHWGYDSVGFLPAGVAIIRQNYTAATGNPLPCGYTINQELSIECDASLFMQYLTDVLSSTVYTDHVVDCRAGVCHTVNQ
jgi:hypothetical protein